MQNLARCTSQLCYLQTQPSSVTALGALGSSALHAGLSGGCTWTLALPCLCHHPDIVLGLANMLQKLLDTG